MNVVANGRSLALDDGATVRDLVVALGLGARAVVVERNGDAVARSEFAGVRLAEGDRVQVVRAVAGG